MKKLSLLLLVSATAFADETALTIYNGGYAVVREALPLDLKAGVNQVSFAGVTARVEPDTVILRAVGGRQPFRILEQSYRNDAVSQTSLLALFEGKTIEFLRRETNKPDRVIVGKLVRSSSSANPYASAGYGTSSVYGAQPIVEVDGKLQFSLPGDPIFPSLGDDSALRPALNWSLEAESAGKVRAEVAYLTQGVAWDAAYNCVGSEKGDTMDISGWVTMVNSSGTSFKDAQVKLMAGDVNRVQVSRSMAAYAGGSAMDSAARSAGSVTERAIDEFHLYSLPRPITLRDKETKQVEFIRVTGVKTERIYVFDGASGRTVTDYESGRSTVAAKVQVFREFLNTKENGLGVALPKGRMRFYVQGADRQLEFVGENAVEHTAKDERVRVLTGNSFDLVGERRQTNTSSSSANNTRTESFEIKLRNRKKEPVEIRVVEHATKYSEWAVLMQSHPFEKTDARTLEFRVTLQPDEEKTVAYSIKYSW